MKQKDFLYTRLTDMIADKIKAGTWKTGERLPSVRLLSREQGISVNTAKRVFLELEAQSLIVSRPQSGYFVSPLPYQRLPLTAASQPSQVATNAEPNELIDRVYSHMGSKDLTLFSIGVPSGYLLPQAKLKKEIITATRELQEGGTAYEPLQGNVKLRRMIAVRSLAWGGRLKESDIVTTHGCMNALALCLTALTRPGDTIALESPCYPGILQLARSMGLRVLEVATHPVTGIDMDALKKILPQIKVCLLVPNFNTPLGYCMPDAHKKEVVALLARHNIPLIEDDTYGDIHFGPQRPTCCKAFDKDENVLWCGSASKTLAPGYRVGWVAPGKYSQQIQKLKLIQAIATTSLMQEVVGSFFMNGRYDHHLRHLRKVLQENYGHYAHAIAEYFPQGTKISQPQGGLALWVALPKGMDTTELYNYALKKRISIAPGRMFSLQDQFQNCMRLCIGLPWTEELKLGLQQLGYLAKMLGSG